MKTSAKKKEELNEKKKKQISPQTSERTLSEQEKTILHLWENEVKGLLDRKFETFEEAVDAIVDGVLLKMEKNPATKEATRNFLEEFMTSDPDMESEIKSIFKLN